VITRPRRQKNLATPLPPSNGFFYFVVCAHRQQGMEMAKHVQKLHQTFLATNVTACNTSKVCRLENAH